MMMHFCRNVLLACLVLVAVSCDALTQPQGSKWQMSVASSSPRRGCAKRPFEKQKVAVFGAGGYLGGMCFGFLQRASSLYGTGVGGVRSICATAFSAECLNRILSKHFVLAFAGEDMIRLTNMKDQDMITQRLEGYSAVILGTEYYLEERPVTGNSYERTPNDKTYEFYLDEPRTTGMGVEVNDGSEIQLSLFCNTLEACRAAGIKHVVVIESPQTEHAKRHAQLLDDAGIPFTYVRVCGDLQNFRDYTYAKGLQGDLQVDSYTFSVDYDNVDGYVKGSWIDTLGKHDSTSSAGREVVYREDVAALAVQCLQSLNWSTSRCLVVSSLGPLTDKPVTLQGRTDREWCVNSNVLADKLAVVQ